MNPVHFPEETTVLAKNQPQFRTLPVAIRLQDPLDIAGLKKFTCKYEFTDLEFEQIKLTRSIYINQFGHSFHPIMPQVDSPFLVCLVHYRVLENSNYFFSFPLSDGGTQTLEASLDKAIETLCELGKVKPDQLCFVEMPSSGIDEKGNVVNL